jgi:lysophospholipase L1-like esterase
MADSLSHRSPLLHRHPRLARLGLFLGAILFALLLGEVALRILGIAYPNFYQVDPVRGWALRPGAEGRWVREGDAWVEINRDGWRERDLPSQKTLEQAPGTYREENGKEGGTFRVAVLGDSMTEAMQVAAEATFPRILEERLQDCPTLPEGTERVEVLNFGVAGYGTAQELLTLQHAVWPYQPDLVLLAFFPGNDVRNNVRGLQYEGRRPYFQLSETGELVLDDRFRQTRGYQFRRSLPGRALYTLLDHARLAQAVKEAWAQAAIGRQRQIRTAGADTESGLDPEVYRPPQEGLWEGAWSVSEALILAIRDATESHGARFALTSLTEGQVVHPDPEARRAGAAALGLEDFGYPGERLAGFAAEHGVHFLDLVPPMARRAEETGTYFHGFDNTRPATGHWNEAGHAVAGELLAEWLCPTLTAPTPHRTPPVSPEDPAPPGAPATPPAAAPAPPTPR